MKIQIKKNNGVVETGSGYAYARGLALYIDSKVLFTIHYFKHKFKV